MAEIDNNYIFYAQLQNLNKIIFDNIHTKDTKCLEKEDCDRIMEEIIKNEFSYKDLGRLYPSSYNNIISNLTYMYDSHVYPIIELLFDHIDNYTHDDIDIYPRIFRQACIYGRLPLIQKLLHEKRIYSDVQRDFIETYIVYSFWKDFCRKVSISNNSRDVQIARIEIANILLDMYPKTLIQVQDTMIKHYKNARKNGLYLVAKYIFLFYNIHRVKDDVDSFGKMFICACECNANELIQICCRKNPYKYTIDYSGTYIFDPDDYIIMKENGEYGIIRSLRNELWERKRLLLYQLHYRNGCLPIDVVRYMFSYLKEVS